MNIRNCVSNDHIMSISEIAKSQAQMIQLFTIEINDLQKQLEAYENMRKEANVFIKKKQKLGALNYVDINDLLNILNKVGGSDE